MDPITVPLLGLLVWSQRHWILWAADRTGHQVIHTGWWTSDHVLALTNVLLAGAALAAIFVSLHSTKITLNRSDAQLRLDTDAFHGTTKPIVVELAGASSDGIGVDVSDGGQSFDVSVTMRNVGSGPAFLRKAEFEPGGRPPVPPHLPVKSYCRSTRTSSSVRPSIRATHSMG